ncbi:protein containing Beta-ketoacyl synthase, partial [Candidatus Magnetomorum sp. HK-1]
MTFGLTEGWWLFEDRHLRVPGSPVLTEQSWQIVLERCGFHHVSSDRILSDNQESGSQRIMIAFSDGLNVKEAREVISETEQFENPSIDALASYLSTHYKKQLSDMPGMHSQMPQPLVFDKGRQTKKTPSPEKAIVRKKPSIIKIDHRDIAIIGVQGRYPQANTIDEFWSNLKNGRNCIEEIPKDRWDIDAFYHADKTSHDFGNIYARWGGFIQTNDIAIIGVSGQFPMAVTKEDFWMNILQGKDCIEEIPKSRWDYRQ